jgi:hypothetical protein
MKCLQCGSNDLMRVSGLSLGLDGVPGRESVGAVGIYCRHCHLLMLQVQPGAIPVEAVSPLNPEAN